MVEKPIYITGVDCGNSHLISSNIKDVLVKSSDHLSWLSDGDVVLLKPAINSPCPYPSTTHPLAIKTLTQELEEKGAKVVVGVNQE